MEQIPHELYEDARKRVKQKKLLFFHFIVFILGSLLMYVSSEFLMEDSKMVKWYPWVIAVWGFVFVFHAINVLIVDSFMNKKWERKQIDKLIEKQQKKISEIEAKIAKEYPIEVEKAIEKNSKENNNTTS